MADDKRPNDKQHAPPPAQTGTSTDANGRKAQIDEAKDEGAGKLSVPVEDMTTANDK